MILFPFVRDLFSHILCFLVSRNFSKEINLASSSFFNDFLTKKTFLKEACIKYTEIIFFQCHKIIKDLSLEVLPIL